MEDGRSTSVHMLVIWAVKGFKNILSFAYSLPRTLAVQTGHDQGICKDFTAFLLNEGKLEDFSKDLFIVTFYNHLTH